MIFPRPGTLPLISHLCTIFLGPLAQHCVSTLSHNAACGVSSLA